MPDRFAEISCRVRRVPDTHHNRTFMNDVIKVAFHRKMTTVRVSSMEMCQAKFAFRQNQHFLFTLSLSRCLLDFD